MPASTDDFDAFSADYDALLNRAIAFSGADAGYFADYKVDLVVARERGRSVSSLLDLGCGIGSATARFSAAWPQAQFEGVDVSADSVVVAQMRAQRGGIARAHFRHYDGQQLPYADASFDVVFIAVVLHHVPLELRASLMAEVRRVLRPGGRVYVFEHNPYNPLTRRVVRECPFDAGAVLLRPGECAQLLRQAGLAQVRVGFRLFVPPHPLLRWLIPVERALEWLPLGGQYYVVGTRP